MPTQVQVRILWSDGVDSLYTMTTLPFVARVAIVYRRYIRAGQVWGSSSGEHILSCVSILEVPVWRASPALDRDTLVTGARVVDCSAEITRELDLRSYQQ